MGVSSSFPPEATADKPAVELFRALQELPAPQTRGGILADEMGLGEDSVYGAVRGLFVVLRTLL